MLASQNIIAFVPIRNAERSKRFYEKTLGLRFISDDSFAMVFDANGVMLRLVKMQEFTPAPFTIVGWQVENIENIVSHLRKKGVAFEIYGFMKQDSLGIWTAPEGAKVAWFKDPDENLLSVSQHPPETNRHAPIKKR